MTIYIYSDESGVFDQKNNDYFVFGGLIFLSKQSRDDWSRKYIRAERTVRDKENIPTDKEIKASVISNHSKSKLYRSLNGVEKFGIVIHEKKLSPNLFVDKKGKQRYLDWAYKIAVKRKFTKMISDGLINADEVTELCFYVDEHTTATNGVYELRESLEQEFSRGTYSCNWMVFHSPIFPNLKSVNVLFCNSRNKTLIRAADIVSNKLYFLCTHGQTDQINKGSFNIEHHP